MNYYINAADLALISNDKNITFKILKDVDKLDKPLSIKVIVK